MKRTIREVFTKNKIITVLTCLFIYLFIYCITVLYTLNRTGNRTESWVIVDGGSGGNNVDKAITNANDTPNKCIEVRGTNGYWFQDDEFSKETFYHFEFRSNLWFVLNEKKSSAVYPGTFNWKDTSLGRDDKHCQIRPVNKSSFCDTMRKHQIRRILFVGDSMTISQFSSLAGLLGYNLLRGVERLPELIECDDFSVKMKYIYENIGPNLRFTNITHKAGPEIPYCIAPTKKNMYPDHSSEYCPWHLLYNKTNEKTLLVLNQGPHFHSLQIFAESFDKFVQLFNSIAHPGDIVVFRSTVPGHYDCWAERNSEISPLNMTHDKFLARYGTNIYDWNLFDAYNSYAKKRLHDLTPSVTSHYLNVYNMTVLRSDQHKERTDCLHYFHPGPVDFWNHLLFTNLADMAL